MRNVTFGYNKSRQPLLKDFSLAVEPGQRVALVGPSGSGKSTLARLVSGICQPWSGEILFDGHARDEIPAEVLRRSISMVDQDAVLFLRDPPRQHHLVEPGRSPMKSSAPRPGTPRSMTKSCSGRTAMQPSSRKVE